jgi:putative DNA primase/helicase
MGLDFQAVGEAALATATVLLPQWIGGKRQGHEWVGERKANGGPGDSWSVNLNTGRWACFADDNLKGGDLVSLYAALNHLDQLAALKAVAALVGITDSNIPVLPRSKPPEQPAEPIPADAPKIPIHPVHGAPSAEYRYGSSFVVQRYDTDKGKVFSQHTWRGGKWAAKGYPDPKPLYGVEGLAERPTAPVMIVEGEKCVEAARTILKAYVILTWAGGSGAVKKSDWSVLSERDIIIWPDNDEPGSQASAKLAEVLSRVAKRIRVIVPTDVPTGWDIADAIADGWDAKKITTWATAHIKTVTIPMPVAVLAESPTPIQRSESLPDAAPATYLEAGVEQESAVVNWGSLGLDCAQGGVPHPTIANVSLILQAHPAMRGRVWYDEFTAKVYHTLRGAEREWTDADDTDLTVRIQQSMRLPKFGIQLVQQGVEHAARQLARNSLTDWLGSLKWDGIERLDNWLVDCLGCERNEYTTAISNNWPISMVARGYVPGCKVDTMPVLEGVEGLHKSSFLEVLGDPWYGSLPTAFGDKDFLQAIQGRWLIEVPDMTGFTRRDHSHIIATITIRKDIYRASYGRRTVEHPRTAVFAATSNNDDYLQDTRGIRRYWPIRCQAIDLDILRAQREQVFAEAVLKYRSGAKWYEMPATAAREQLDRSAPDLWTDRIMQYADELVARRLNVTSERILIDAIELPRSKHTDAEKRRIARIMRENNWVQVRDPDRRWKKVIRRDESGLPTEPLKLSIEP